MGVKHTITALATGLMAQHAAAIDPITAKGQYLFYSSNGTQMFIKGVAYQQGIAPGGASESTSTTSTTFIDSLADATSCARDIPLLQELGTNTIRVYAIDPTADHGACMAALDAAGIYVIADLSVPGESINRDSPAWTTDLYARYTGVIDNLAQYDNTLGFFAGNEVTNNKTNSNSAAFVKAAVRDTKAYIKSKNFGRWIGVGYATNDDAETRDLLANYFNCDDQDAAVDFWGYNIYEWCGQSTFQESGYEERTNAFANFSVPAFFSEYGCNINTGGADGRVFQDTPVLYSDQMNKVWSGGIVYEYFQEQNDYGLVSLSGSTVTKKKDFAPLANAIAAVNANASSSTITLSSYTPSNVPRDCPTVSTTSWLASDTLPPTPNATICENMLAASACVPATTLSADDQASLFGTVCGLSASACAGITSNATTGVYGAYVMCNATQQLANALNTYYVAQKKAATACDFGGQAKVVTPSETLLPNSGGSTGGSGSSVSISPVSSSSSSSSAGAVSSTPASSNGAQAGSSSSAGSETSSSSGSSSSTSVASAYVNGTKANNGTSTQSTGSNSNGAARLSSVVGNWGWAGSLLVAVGAVAVTL